jgi:hypothetical protein
LFGNAALRLVHAELTLSLPGRPPVRRELLRLDSEPRVIALRPDETPAHAVLETGAGHMLASLAGPERADLEVEWFVESAGTVRMPLWAIARGRDAEVSLWDAFGRLVVPDALARGTDATDLELGCGHHVLTATVFGETALLVGVGITAQAVHARTARSVAG